MIRTMVAELPLHSLVTPSFFTVSIRNKMAPRNENCLLETVHEKKIMKIHNERKLNIEFIFLERKLLVRNCSWKKNEYT